MTVEKMIKMLQDQPMHSEVVLETVAPGIGHCFIPITYFDGKYARKDSLGVMRPTETDPHRSLVVVAKL